MAATQAPAHHIAVAGRVVGWADSSGVGRSDSWPDGKPQALHQFSHSLAELRSTCAFNGEITKLDRWLDRLLYSPERACLHAQALRNM